MKKKEEKNEPRKKGIIPVSISSEMKESYLDYAMSVITARALPDVRDGLKPVHRRILYAMHKMGLTSSAKFRKSAAVVGDVLGRYHPHGDSSVYDAMTKMAQDFSFRYPLVIGQGNFGCFTKDTKVRLADGRSLSFEELTQEDMKGKNNYTFTINSENKIEIACIVKPRMTKKNAEIMEVVLDNGEKIKCTLSHKFLLKNGTYCEAQNLKQGTSLMPLYIRLSQAQDTSVPEMIGYEMVLHPNHEEWVFSHHLADAYNITHNMYNTETGRVRHHIDFNKLNNSPENIQRMQWLDHWNLHSRLTSKRHKTDLEYVQKLAKGREVFWSKKKNRQKYAERLSKRNKENWKNSLYREKMCATLSEQTKRYIQDHPERRIELSKQATRTLKRLWRNPEYRAFMHEKIIKGNKNHTTNKTGKVKFDGICRAVLNEGQVLSQETYEKTRLQLYPTKAATKWETGLYKYYTGDVSRALAEIQGNHKVKEIIFRGDREDVYDLTIENTHNFALDAGVFVHNSIDGDPPAAMRYCVTGDTYIPTEHGLMPIKDISPDGEEDVSTKVLSKDRKVNRASKWFDSGEHPTKKIRTKRGYSIQGSHNHPLLVWIRSSATGRPSFVWKLLSQIKEGDIVVLDRTSDALWPKKNHSLLNCVPEKKGKRVKEKILPGELNEDLASLLGAFVAEGSIKEKKLEFCNSDRVWVADFEKKWKKLFPDCRLHRFKRQPSSFGKKPYLRLEVHSLHVISFLRNCGLLPQLSKDKMVPHAILKSPKSVMAAFLRAYFEGDGSISYSEKMIELSAISTSRELLNQIQIMLLRFGIASSHYYDKHRQIHKLYIRSLRDYILFEEQIGFISMRKKEKLRYVIKSLKKDYSQTDFVPYIQDFTRSILAGSYERREFAIKHNFDRYPNMKENYSLVVTAVKPKARLSIEHVFESLLSNYYLFDAVSSVENAGINRVYSLKVESPCHSFIGNGFINHNTEAKMSQISGELIRDIEKETVDFRPNYDSTKTEPTVFPSVVPNILLNGTLGIAVGMATNIPPHNLKELADATTHLIDNPEATTEDLLKFVKGPDFPTGGIIFNQKDINHAYANGRGGVVTRGGTEIIEDEKGNASIIISSIPYRVNKADLIIKIANLVREKKLDGIKSLRDESTTDIRIVIELKGTAQPQKVLNYIYKHTQLEDTFHFNMVALVDGVPQTLSLKPILEEFVSHREKVVRRRTQFDLKKAESREHILLGLKKALDSIDKIIKLIKKSKDVKIAHYNLMKEFKFSDLQATAILEMKLQKLAGLERKKIEEELTETQKAIKSFKALLASPKKILDVVKKEIQEIAEKYGDERRTRVVKGGVKNISDEDIIPDEESILVLTAGGYIKRTNPKEYKKQKRGGVGVIDLNTKDEDFITTFLTTTTHSDLLFFTDKGKVYQIKMYEVPEGKRATRGKSVMNFLSLNVDEKVTSVVPMPKSVKKSSDSLLMVTKNGVAKRVLAESFYNVRRSGLLAIKLAKGDQLISAAFIEKGNSAIIATSLGQAIRFRSSDIRVMGRTAAGVRAIKLKKDDYVVGAGAVRKDSEESNLLVVSENGFGKKTSLNEYKIQKRGGSGIKTAKVNTKTGNLIAAKVLNGEESEIIAISKNSQVIRSSLKEVPNLGRQTQGVKIMKLRPGDSLASVVCI